MNQNLETSTQSMTKKPYVAPEVIHELELETRAGTPVSIFPPDGLEDIEPVP